MQLSTRLAPMLMVCALWVSACGGPDSAQQQAAGDDAPAESPAADDAGAGQEGNGGMGHDANGGTSHTMTMLGRDSWHDMTMKLAAAEPAEFVIFQGADQAREVTPEPDDSMHLMVVLQDAQSGMRIPYSTVWVTVTDESGQTVVDKRAWPMLARAMGNHYGLNVALPEQGTYEAEVQVGPPQVARHAELRDAWRDQHVFTVSVDWAGQV